MGLQEILEPWVCHTKLCETPTPRCLVNQEPSLVKQGSWAESFIRASVSRFCGLHLTFQRLLFLLDSLEEGESCREVTCEAVTPALIGDKYLVSTH